MICWFHFFFFFTAPATTEIYTLSLHDALPICGIGRATAFELAMMGARVVVADLDDARGTETVRASSRSATTTRRSEEHTSELQSHSDLVCRLLLEKKKIQCEPTQE